MRRIIILLFCLFLFSCITTSTEKESSTVPTLLNEKFSHIKSWNIDFKYENITVESKRTDEDSVEVVETDYGQSDMNVFLLDYLKSHLADDYNVRIEPENEAEGFLPLHPVIHRCGTTSWCVLISLFVYDKNMELLHKSEIMELYSFTIRAMFDDITARVFDIIQ